nr:hypothetical protein [Tanacetum cinerariifolium]
MAIDGVGWDWSYMANDEENLALVADKEAPIEFALMANTSAESKVFDNSLCSKDCKRNTDSLKSKITDLTNKLFDAKNMIYHYKLGLAQVKSRLVEYKDREIKYCEKIKGLEYKTESSDDYIEIIKKELELIKKEKESLDGKLAGFQTASKDLDNLLESQRLDKNKEGLGYNVVPPPPAQIYFSPKKDLSWTGLLEFKDDTITDYSRPAPTVESSQDDAQNRNSSVTKTEASISTISPKSFIKFVRANDSPTKSKIDKAEKAKKSPVKKRVKRGTSRSQNNTHKSFTPRPDVHKHYRPPMRPMRSNMNGARPNRTSFNKPAHSYTNRPFQRTSAGSSQNNIDDKVYWDSGCSRHMTCNISYLYDFELFDGGYVSFGQGGFKITGKRTIKTDKLKFENVCFVKDLKCDNRGEFRNKEMNDFCSQKGIKRDFSNARTPQQNGVAERRNRTLIKATKTMLADAKLPVTFWAEAVNTVCYVQNNNLGKFEAKGDEGYFIGYSMSSKAFRVFNKRIRRVKENLHVEFLENKAIEKGDGLNWLFNIDSLTKSMNYVPVDAGTNSTNLSCTKDETNQELKKNVSSLRYIALPNWVHDALLESSSSKPQDDCCTDVPESSGNSNPTATSTNPLADQLETLTVETPIPTVSSPVPTACFTDSPEPSSDARLISKRVANQVETPSLDNILTLSNRFEDILRVTTNTNESNGVEANVSNMETTITTSPTPTLRIHKDHPKSKINGPIDTLIQTRNKSKQVGEQSFIATIHQKTDPTLLQFCLFSCFLSQVKPKKISDALQDPSWVEAMQEELLQFKIQNVWTLVDCPKGDPNFLAKVYNVEKAMYGLQAPRAWQKGDFILVQDYVDDIIFGSSNPQLCREFKALMHKKFQMSAMGKLNFFFGLQVLQKEDGIFLSQDKHQVTPKECHLHAVKRIFRYLKGHPKLRLWYPKESPFDLVAYSDSVYGGATQDRKSTTEGCQFLGRRLISWQCKKQTIVATSTTEAEYVAAATFLVCMWCAVTFGCFTIDARLQTATTFDLVWMWLGGDYGNVFLMGFNGIQWVGLLLIIEVTFLPLVDFVEASPLMYALTIKPTVYVAHIHQFWSTAMIKTVEEGTKILATVDGIIITVTESSLRRNLKLQDEEGISSLPDTELFENLTLMGYNISPNQKFTFQKGQFSHQWKYLIHTIMQCLSPKSTGFNEFSSNIATALVCLATNRTYDFSKMIFDGLVKNVNNKGEGSGTPSKPHHTPSPEAQHTSYTTHSSQTLPPVTTASIPTVTLFETTSLRQYTRRARIAHLGADQDRANIAKTSTLPYDSVPRVTSPAADEGTHEMEINRLKARVKLLEDRDGVAAERSRDDAPIKMRNLDEGEAVVKRVSNDTEEMDTVLTSMDAATVLASRAAEVPTGSGSISSAGSPAAEVSTGSDVVPTASLIFSTTTMVTPYGRRKGKEIMVESETPKKKKVQEHIDAQVTREFEEQIAREDQRMSEQVARDAKVTGIHAEEELQMMINSLDRINETAQQRKPWSKKQKRDYYMAVIKSNLGWKVKDFRGMTFKEIKAKFTTVWKQLEDFIPMGSKEEAKRLKRKGLSLEQESVKKLKTSKEVPEEAKSLDEVPEEKHMDREDLNQLWALVKESLSNRQPTNDKEMELWVELKRLYEPDNEDQLWTHTQNLMHAPVEWKLYDMCEVHQVTYKDKEIFMLVEKDYPLRKGLAIVMICYKLQVKNYSHMENDMILKIYTIVNCPSQQGD